MLHALPLCGQRSLGNTGAIKWVQLPVGMHLMETAAIWP